MNAGTGPAPVLEREHVRFVHVDLVTDSDQHWPVVVSAFIDRTPDGHIQHVELETVVRGEADIESELSDFERACVTTDVWIQVLELDIASERPEGACPGRAA